MCTCRHVRRVAADGQSVGAKMHQQVANLRILEPALAGSRQHISNPAVSKELSSFVTDKPRTRQARTTSELPESLRCREIASEDTCTLPVKMHPVGKSSGSTMSLLTRGAAECLCYPKVALPGLPTSLQTSLTAAFSTTFKPGFETSCFTAQAARQRACRRTVSTKNPQL